MPITVNSAAALTSALKAAPAGETILLAPGTYSGVYLRYFNLNNVTVASQDPSNPAVLTSLAVRDSSGITFRDVEVKVDAAATYGVDLLSVSNVHFVGIDVHGSLDGNPQNDAGGMLVRNSRNVSIEDSEFHELSLGISHAGNEYLDIRGNAFHDMRADGIRGGGSSWLTITDNSFIDFYPFATDHADAIQLWTTNVTTVTHDILISGNSIRRGAGSDYQGIFINDEKNVGYERVEITGNLVSGSSYHGIYVDRGRDVTISDNIVQGYADKKAWIRIDDVDGGTLTNNQTTHLVVTDNASGIVSSGNTTLPLATDGGAWALAAWEGTRGLAAGGGLNLVGDAGANTLIGGALADTLAGGAGTDLLVGDAGSDLYIIDGKAVITELADGGVDSVRSSVGYTLPSYVENLELVGTKAINAYGNALDNVLTGNAAVNSLRGGAGNDTLNGGAGNDYLDGESGNDRLTGGPGADVFVYGRGDGADVITDFGANGDHDVLDLSALYSAGKTATLVNGAGGVTVSFLSGPTITLLGVDASDLIATSSGFTI